MQVTLSSFLLLLAFTMVAGCQETQQSGNTPSMPYGKFEPQDVAALNGQLEAAATDALGRFETGFHVLDYRPDDLFEIRVGSLDAPVVHRFSSELASATGDPFILHIEHES